MPANRIFGGKRRIALHPALLRGSKLRRCSCGDSRRPEPATDVPGCVAGEVPTQAQGLAHLAPKPSSAQHLRNAPLSVCQTPNRTRSINPATTDRRLDVGSTCRSVPPVPSRTRHHLLVHLNSEARERGSRHFAAALARVRQTSRKSAADEYESTCGCSLLMSTRSFYRERLLHNGQSVKRTPCVKATPLCCTRASFGSLYTHARFAAREQSIKREKACVALWTSHKALPCSLDLDGNSDSEDTTHCGHDTSRVARSIGQ